MTFLNQLRDIAARAAHSTEPGRVTAELANAIADQVEIADQVNASVPPLAAAEPAPAQTPAA